MKEFIEDKQILKILAIMLILCIFTFVYDNRPLIATVYQAAIIKCDKDESSGGTEIVFNYAGIEFLSDDDELYKKVHALKSKEVILELCDVNSDKAKFTLRVENRSSEYGLSKISAAKEVKHSNKDCVTTIVTFLMLFITALSLNIMCSRQSALITGKVVNEFYSSEIKETEAP